jgi:DNA-binding NarL/FixJ family response regulator
MSGRSGAEILAELNIRHPELRVLVVTDDVEPQQRHVATLLGAEDFLVRPLDPAAVAGKTDDIFAQLERERDAG